MRGIIRRAVLFVLLFSVAASACAQVTVRCGMGTTTAAGLHINGQGDVVVAEDVLVCGQSPVGPVMPAPLQLAILSPPGGLVIEIGPQPVTVPFSASIVNYAAAHDQCRATVTSPTGGTAPLPNNPVTLVPAGDQASATLVFPPGIPSGTYSLALQCTRTVNGQQVVVNNPAARPIIVSSAPGPVQCPPISAVFSPHVAQNYTSPYAPNGGWGVPPNQAVSWLTWIQSHVNQPGWLTTTQLRSWKFTAPPASRMLLETNSSGTSHELVMSVSECPGDFHPELATCLAASSMVWRTRGDGFGQDCVLNPGTEYYLNIAVFDLPYYLATGQFRSMVGCQGFQCPFDMRATPQ